MIRLIPEKTSIWNQRISSILDLQFEANAPLSWSTVRVVLDKSMVPLPPTFEPSGAVAISLDGPSLQLPILNDSVSPDDHLVTFRLFWVDVPKLQRRRFTLRKQIAFRWRDSLAVPKQISFAVTIAGLLGRRIASFKVRGINVKNSPIYLISKRRKSDFYFPTQESMPHLAYGDAWEVVSEVQDMDDSTGWAYTGPEDLIYWESDEATVYLSRQLARIWRSNFRDRPTRMALSPVDLDISDSVLRRFLKILELQAVLGIEILIIRPRSVETTTGSHDVALGGFGSALGLRWVWIGEPDQANSKKAALYLTRDSIAYLKEEYLDLARQATAWKLYKQQKQIQFLDAEQREIVIRSSKIRILARELLDSLAEARIP